MSWSGSLLVAQLGTSAAATNDLSPLVMLLNQKSLVLILILTHVWIPAPHSVSAQPCNETFSALYKALVL